MTALITGASSEVGKSMAKILSNKGYNLILVCKNKKELYKLKSELGKDVKIIITDISSTFNCMRLYNRVKDENVEILINNAGFGLYGNFYKTSITNELDMIDLNIKATHILTKMFFKKFKENNKGYILNVLSTTAFLPVPLMSSYYATESYVLNLSETINEELKQEKSNVYVGVFCPKTLKPNINNNVKTNSPLNVTDCDKACNYAIKMMFNKKTIIIPGILTKLGIIIIKLLPRSVIIRINYNIQKSKQKI